MSIDKIIKGGYCVDGMCAATEVISQMSFDKWAI